MKQTNASQRTARSLHSCALALSVAAAFVLSGCGGEQKQQAGGGNNHSHHASAAPDTAAPDNAYVVPDNGQLTIESSDNMRYSLTNFVVRPGQQVELTFKHTGRMPVSAMGHNVVLLKKYTDVRAFAQASARSASTDYIPRSMASQVIAHTKMLGGGQSDTITFTAPSAPGEYDFICSFPAHLSAGMQGKMIVRRE